MYTKLLDLFFLPLVSRSSVQTVRVCWENETNSQRTLSIERKSLKTAYEEFTGLISEKTALLWRIYSVDYGITDFLSGAGKTSNTIYERSRWLPYGVSALRYNTAMPCWLIQKAYLSSWITVRSELINMHVWFVITSRIIDSSWRRAKTERHRHSSKNDTNN